MSDEITTTFYGHEPCAACAAAIRHVYDDLSTTGDERVAASVLIVQQCEAGQHYISPASPG